MLEPRFYADAMLGKLARWLILMGYDAKWAGHRPRADLELLEECHREGRVFLTRDTGIPEVAGLRKLVLREQAFEGQLRRVFKLLGLKADPSRFFTRCSYCNLPLESVPREEALALVPPLVKELDTAFWRCPSCKRMYWEGTHSERARDKIKRLGL